MEILRRRLIENDEHLTSLTLEFNDIVMPAADEEDVTHFWAIIETGGAESDPPILYVGTPDTFATRVADERKPLPS